MRIAEPTHGRVARAGRAPYVVLAIALASTLGAALAFRASVNERDEGRFRSAIQTTEDRIESRLGTYSALLLATRSMLATHEGNVDREHFHTFVDGLDLHERYPGIQGVGFSRRLAASDRDAVEAEVRRAGTPDFRIWPEQPGEELHTIVLLEPLDRRNRAALGFDMFTESVRHEAMVSARDTGRPAASGPVTLVQEIDDQKQVGFLVYLPVYRGGVVPETVEQRRAALLGFVYSPFRMDDLLVGIFGSEKEPRLGFDVRDRAAPETLLHRSGPPPSAGAMRATSALEVGGRTWTLQLWTLPPFERASERWMWPYVVGAGVVACLLLFAISYRQALTADQLRIRGQVLDDMSRERQEILAREQALRAQAEAASRTKDDFLAMLGHELRNPLAPIVTALALLEHRGQLAGIREVGVITRQVAHLQRLLDDLLDVSAIARGRVKLEKRHLNVDAAIDGAVELVRPLVDERHQQLEVDVARDMVVDADESRLIQIVGNLLHNAAKYTHAGGHIALKAAREGDDAVIRVSDDGEGIRPSALDRLFELFEQGERSADRSKGGLGIGLAVVRRLVELHGGTVEGRSEGPGTGSEFIVRLPLVRDTAETAPSRPRLPAADVAHARRRVLVVDDNTDAAEMLVELMQHAGHEVAVAYEGQQALDLADASVDAYDIAILDIGLPGMDGFELAERLREKHAARVLIAVTGYGQERDRTMSRSAGFDHHFVKPVDTAQLLEAVASAR